MSTLLTLQEAAARLNISPKHTRGLINDGKLKWINVGRGDTKPRIRVSPDDIDEFEQINKRTETSSPCPFTKTKNRRSTRMTSGSKIVDIKTLRTQQRKPKP